jgi:hypothetical protein
VCVVRSLPSEALLVVLLFVRRANSKRDADPPEGVLDRSVALSEEEEDAIKDLQPATVVLGIVEGGGSAMRKRFVGRSGGRCNPKRISLPPVHLGAKSERGREHSGGDSHVSPDVYYSLLFCERSEREYPWASVCTLRG